MSLGATIRRHRRLVEVALLAVLAYVPALTAAPGRVPADTKLYLYLDPGRLLSDALWSYDSRQLAGWVPHQTVGYLWPSGPWYWLFETLGVPDWIAQRLWIGTILLAAGAGVRWGAKVLGLAPLAAITAAVVYQLSPYVLPYVSRTSVLLLPFAGLGWLVGLTARAATRTRWRDAALFALVVLTVGGINATAVIMIAPAPVLWLLDAAFARTISWRKAGVTALKLGGLSLAVSLWWLTALSIQARFGGQALAYSETLESVSFTATATEVLRGLGYWLFYVTDPVVATTTASRVYQSSPAVLAAGFALVAAGAAGIALARWRGRRFAALCVAAGLILAVGAHPIDDPSPLGQPLASSSRSTLVLAMRSSTRAVPLVVLGLALGIAALVGGIDRWRPRAGWWAAGLAGLLAIVNLPALWTGAYVDPELERPEQLPAQWDALAQRLDELPAGYRVLQVPGVESAIYRWGYTVDHPLPGLTNRAVVTRDWLPLGSPAAMDTLYALDDRYQAGVAEPAALAPIARLFGADQVLVVPETAFERFRTPRPESTWDSFRAEVPGLGELQGIGEPQVQTPTVPMLDERELTLADAGSPVPPLGLAAVEDAQPVVRVGGPVVLLSGSGDGVVDAAAAGLLRGDEVIRYAAAVDDLDQAAGDAQLVLVTDSNRVRAHQWRGSQDVWGFTEDGTNPGVLDEDTADHRLPVFDEDRTGSTTVAEQRGPVRATASRYGEPNAYRPEDRAVRAVDGDLATAWLVADRAEPIGQRIRFDATQPVDAINVVQPLDVRVDRWITQVRLTTSSGEDRLVDLTDTSRTADGQDIRLEAPADWWQLEIASTNTPRSAAYPSRGPVGFAEVRTELGPTDEVVVVPSDALAAVGDDAPVALVLTRLRTDPLDRWRSDPETALVRAIDLSGPLTTTPEISVRLDRRAPDAVLAALLGDAPIATADERLAGAPQHGGWAAVDGDPETSWLTPFAVGAGSTLTIPTDPSAVVDRLTIQVDTDPRLARPTEVEVRVGDQATRVPLDPADPDGVYELALPAATGDPVQLTIAATTGAATRDRRYGEQVQLPVGIAEVSGPGITPVTLPETLDTGCRDDLLTVDSEPVELRVTGSWRDAVTGEPLTVTACDGGSMSPWTWSAGEHVVRSAPGRDSGLDVDRVVLASDAAAAALAADRPTPPTVEASTGRGRTTATVGPCPDGCWLIQGDGYNTGWSATVDGTDLGRPEQVSGGFNGWYLPPSEETRTVEIRWTPQRMLWIALALSGIAAIACIVLVVLDRRRLAATTEPEPVRLAPPWAADVARHHVVWVAGTVVTALVVAPLWGVVALAVSLPLVWWCRSALVGLAGAGAVAASGAFVVLRQIVQAPLPGFGWVLTAAPVHRLALTGVVLVTAATLPRLRSRTPTPPVASIE